MVLHHLLDLHLDAIADHSILKYCLLVYALQGFPTGIHLLYHTKHCCCFYERCLQLFVSTSKLFCKTGVKLLLFLYKFAKIV